MERRKFLANLVCLTVGASLAPKVIGKIGAPEPSVDPRIFEYPLTEKEAFRPPIGFVPGCITSISDKEITVYPLSGLEEFPALKKGDKIVLFSNGFSETVSKPLNYGHEEKESEHYIIIVQEDVPCVGKGCPVTFKLNLHALSYIKLHDNLLFLK